MYELSYILHIAGVAVWLGSFLALGWLLRSLSKERGKLKSFAPVLRRIQSWVMWGVIPALLVIVLSGVYMILQFERDTLPLYLTLMEQGGTMIILLTIILVSIYSVKLSKKLKGSTLKKDRPLAGITKIYANYLLISTLAGIGIIIVVGLRLT